MYRPLLEFLTAPNLRAVEAGLNDYRCLGVKRTDYPAIEAHAGAVVNGMLVMDIPATAWQRLDRYEGEMYRRTVVQVQLSNGENKEARTYVIRPRYSTRLTQREWQYGYESEVYAKAQLEVMVAAARKSK